MELREAREAQAAGEQKAAAVECMSPELAREDADSGDRLAGEKRRLEEEVSALRVQVERLSTAASDGREGGGDGVASSAPGSPADGQRPAVGDTPVTDETAVTDKTPVTDETAVTDKTPVTDETAVTDANNATSSKSNGRGNASGEDVGAGGSERSGGAEGSGLTRKLVEAETERVLAELRANPSASTKALMLARAEMNARASEVVAKLSATGLVPPPPPLPTALHEDLGL